MATGGAHAPGHWAEGPRLNPTARPLCAFAGVCGAVLVWRFRCGFGSGFAFAVFLAVGGLAGPALSLLLPSVVRRYRCGSCLVAALVSVVVARSLRFRLARSSRYSLAS